MVLLAVLLVLFVYYFASRSLPDYDKELSVRGLSAPVEIVRNNANVPHIFGESDPDVFFGLGYAHAQDRLWQMVMARRTVQGRLAEVFGTRALNTDKLMRRLDLYNRAQQSVASQDSRTEAALNAYARGVNARLQEVNDDALGRGAPEMFLYRVPVAPWTPADSIALLKLMALEQSAQLQNEVLRARASLMLPDAARLADLLPDAPGQGVMELPAYQTLLDAPLPKYAQSRHAVDAFWPVPEPAMGSASNAWAAAPGRSAAGRSLLANDPHMRFTAPGRWYLARLELSHGGVIGGTIPGIPAVISGRGQQMGWAITASYADDQDLFIERQNPENPEEYQTTTGFKAFETRPSIIRIKDAAPVTLTLRWTDNGPVLPGSMFNLDSITPAGHVAALGWTALSPRDTSMTSVVGMMYAKSIEEAVLTGAQMVAPAWVVTLATPDRVALKMLGAVPRRDAAHQSQGRIPTPGWIAANRWQGRMDYANNPERLDPAGGLVGNTNNKLVDRPFPDHISFDWGDSQRVQRWARLMQARQVHTRDSFKEAQLDTVSVAARTLLPLIGADLWFTGDAAVDGTPEHLRQRALAILGNWNGEMNEHMPEPLIYSAWVRALQQRLVRDELGPLAAAFTHVEPLFIERVFRDVNGAGAWCDVIQSAQVETCSEMARQALDEALITVLSTYGNGLESLRWGDAHQALHQHPELGNSPFIKHLVNIRQSTSGGDHTLSRGVGIGSGARPFTNVHGAGYRGVYDFADPDSSLFILATGQSGHPLSRHYDDMGELWRRGEYIPMALDETLARAAATGVTLLVPRGD